MKDRSLSLFPPELLARLQQHFSEPELVELGYFIGNTLGQQRWIKTLGIKHGEILADTEGASAPSVKRANTV